MSHRRNQPKIRDVGCDNLFKNQIATFPTDPSVSYTRAIFSYTQGFFQGSVFFFQWVRSFGDFSGKYTKNHPVSGANYVTFREGKSTTHDLPFHFGGSQLGPRAHLDATLRSEEPSIPCWRTSAWEPSRNRLPPNDKTPWQVGYLLCCL